MENHPLMREGGFDKSFSRYTIPRRSTAFRRRASNTYARRRISLPSCDSDYSLAPEGQRKARTSKKMNKNKYRVVFNRARGALMGQRVKVSNGHLNVTN